MEKNIKQDKVLGHVIGRLVLAQIDDLEVEDEFILEEPLTKLIRELNTDFYEKSRNTPIDQFWEIFLKPKMELKYHIQSVQEEINQMVDILTSLYQRQPKGSSLSS